MVKKLPLPSFSNGMSSVLGGDMMVKTNATIIPEDDHRKYLQWALSKVESRERRNIWQMDRTLLVRGFGKRQKGSIDKSSPSVLVSTVQGTMRDMFDELRCATDELRDSIISLRKEIEEMQKAQRDLLLDRQNFLDKQANHMDETEIGERAEEYDLNKVYHPRQKEFDEISEEVIQWSEKMFNEDENDGWRKVNCMKALKNKFNQNENIKCWLKWMPDSRCPGKYCIEDGSSGKEDKLHPCIKVIATVDAPFEAVCEYLSDEKAVDEYNELVAAHRDLEEISPNSKITWGQCPQILFVKARDFVTFCQYRWIGETQLVINQAVEHVDSPGSNEESDGRACRAEALRGANYISRDPNDPNKTSFALLAHGNVGGNIPAWATKTAVNTVVPIEPFKLFYRIEKGAQQRFKEMNEERKTELMSSKPKRRRPAGLSQLGYACFWPQGEEGHVSKILSDAESSTKEVVGESDTMSGVNRNKELGTEHQELNHDQISIPEAHEYWLDPEFNPNEYNQHAALENIEAISSF
eukprot:CAMPEP_0113314396 /NCGR_PEP_ID=MMETSP0010_2-20120614/10470_1 /TAXON_ID=216773 ORGANISM="Corethron hystrix, Strain 308" /NCGR_SAMPLE_ID=MMETSP0010_2 /ASSEMBLY_ACC=CAM_ASM_000155 /LENGTH=523 /DNA_ID=CAMNT_0000170667 /DNA_START=385 /DNA_END=1956 /DNA_ORIENTATION=- /assembly_acc=CAM_ASM_000155